MTDDEFEAELKRAVTDFCLRHGPRFRAEVSKLERLWEVFTDNEKSDYVPAYDVALFWKPPTDREKGQNVMREFKKLFWKTPTVHEKGQDVIGEFKKLINTKPFEMVDNDGDPKPNSFIWTVIQRTG